jgi:hypothetical protein
MSFRQEVDDDELFNDTHDVGFLHDEVILTIDLDFGT